MNAVKWGCFGLAVFWGSMFGVVMLVVAGNASGGTSGQFPMATGPPGGYTWPVAGTLTTQFGIRVDPFPPHADEMHWGIDIAADTGTPVLAATSGQIIEASWMGGYGNLIVLAAPGGMVTYYGHLREYAVERGDQVEQGHVIGYVGSTGRSTGAHLHFEMRPNGGNPVDPLQFWGSLTTADFVERLRPFGDLAADKLGVSRTYGAFFITHWAQESGFESPDWISMNGAAYDYAGIKGGSDSWRSYKSMEAFVADYVDVLLSTRIGSELVYAEVIQLMREGAPLDAVFDAMGRSPWDEDHYGRGHGLPDGSLLRWRYQELALWL